MPAEDGAARRRLTNRWELVTSRWSAGTTGVREEEMATLKIVGMDDVYPTTIADIVDSSIMKRAKSTDHLHRAQRTCRATLVVLHD